MSERIVSPNMSEQDMDDEIQENSLRPRMLYEYIGQAKVAQTSASCWRLRRRAASRWSTCCSTGRQASARRRSRTSSPTRWASTSRSLRSGHRPPGALASILSEPLDARRALHRRDSPPRQRRRGVSLPRAGGLSLRCVLGKGPSARASATLPLQPFTVVGATTRQGLLSGPLRDRFGADLPARFLLQGGAREHRAAIGAHPRHRDPRGGGVRDRAARPRHAAHREPPVAARARLRAGARRRTSHGRGARVALRAGHRRHGLEPLDRMLLETIIKKFEGGPVGLDTMAASTCEEAGDDRGCATSRT